MSPSRNPQPSRRPRARKPAPAKPVRVRERLRRAARKSAPPQPNPPQTSARQLPLWLELLVKLQRGSTIIAFSLIGIALAFYAATVYLQQQWSEAYQTLEKLQRETRSLTAADETLKHKLATEAQEEKAGLVLPTPDRTIYLNPASAPATGEFIEQPVEPPPASNVPLGY